MGRNGRMVRLGIWEETGARLYWTRERISLYSPSSLSPSFSVVKCVAQPIKQLDPSLGQQSNAVKFYFRTCLLWDFRHLPAKTLSCSVFWHRSHRTKEVGITFLHREAVFHLLSLSSTKGIFLVLFLLKRMKKIVIRTLTLQERNYWFEDQIWLRVWLFESQHTINKSDRNYYIESSLESWREKKHSSLKFPEVSFSSNNMAVSAHFLSGGSWELLCWATVLEGRASCLREKLIENVLTLLFLNFKNQTLITDIFSRFHHH